MIVVEKCRNIGVNPARQSSPELASAPFGTRMEDTFGLVQSDSMDLQNDPRFFQSNVLDKRHSTHNTDLECGHFMTFRNSAHFVLPVRARKIGSQNDLTNLKYTLFISDISIDDFNKFQQVSNISLLSLVSVFQV